MVVTVGQSRKSCPNGRGGLIRTMTEFKHFFIWMSSLSQLVQRYICTSPKSLFSLLELSFSLLELSFSPFPLRNSRLHPIYNSREQTRITYFSVAKTCFLKMQFSSSVILVYTRITFLYTRIAFLLAREKQKFSSTRELFFLTRELLGISVL